MLIIFKKLVEDTDNLSAKRRRLYGVTKLPGAGKGQQYFINWEQTISWKGGDILSRFNIDVRVTKLGKKNVDVISELHKRGYKVTPGEFSYFKNGRITSPKSDIILEAADKIISEWEAEQ